MTFSVHAMSRASSTARMTARRTLSPCFTVRKSGPSALSTHHVCLHITRVFGTSSFSCSWPSSHLHFLHSLAPQKLPAVPPSTPLVCVLVILACSTSFLISSFTFPAVLHCSAARLLEVAFLQHSTALLLSLRLDVRSRHIILRLLHILVLHSIDRYECQLEETKYQHIRTTRISPEVKIELQAPTPTPRHQRDSYDPATSQRTSSGSHTARQHHTSAPTPLHFHLQRHDSCWSVPHLTKTPKQNLSCWDSDIRWRWRSSSDSRLLVRWLVRALVCVLVLVIALVFVWGLWPFLKVPFYLYICCKLSLPCLCFLSCDFALPLHASSSSVCRCPSHCPNPCPCVRLVKIILTRPDSWLQSGPGKPNINGVVLDFNPLFPSFRWNMLLHRARAKCDCMGANWLSASILLSVGRCRWSMKLHFPAM